MICANCFTEIDGWVQGESEICDACWGNDLKLEIVAPTTELYLCSYLRNDRSSVETIVDATNAEHASKIAAITFSGFANAEAKKANPIGIKSATEVQFIVESVSLFPHADNKLITSRFLQKVNAQSDTEEIDIDTNFYMLVRDKLNNDNMQVQLTVGESKMDAVKAAQPLMDAGVALDMSSAGTVSKEVEGMMYCLVCSKDYTSAALTEFTVTVGGSIRETEEPAYKPPAIRILKSRDGALKNGTIGDMISSRAQLIQDAANKRAEKREDAIDTMLILASTKARGGS